MKLNEADVNNDIGNLLSQSQTNAKETRAELFTNVIWSSGAWLYSSGLAVEYSKISVSGDASGEQSLVYWKPNLSVSYNLSQSTQYRISLERTVDQLDFSDFAASADLIDDRQFSGNPRLSPELSDRISLALDHRYDEKGAINIELFHEWRSGVLEQISLPSGGQGLGDAGNGRVWGLDAAINIPMNFILTNSLLEIKAKIFDSSFDDPVTKLKRGISGLNNPETTVYFRQDIYNQKTSWGIGYQSASVARNYFVDEIDYERTESQWSAFLETSIFDGTKTRLDISNIGDEKTYRERSVFQGNRLGQFEFLERSYRERGIVVSLTFSRAF